MIEKEFAHRLIDQMFEIREIIQEKLIPNEAYQHFQNAKKEGLFGIQATISHLIHEMDKGQKEQPKQEIQVKKIIVEE